MDAVGWVLVIAAVVLIAVLVAWTLGRNLQSRRLKQRFGPEYDRTVERTGGDRKQAESALGERIARREEFELRPMNRETRDLYARRWDEVQAEFVDQPGAATQHAQMLLEAVMAERGYPVGDEFEERADVISVDHPDVVEHYRLAHRLHHESAETGNTGVATEERREALVHYRALFADLLDTADADRSFDTHDTDPRELDREERSI